MAERYIESLIEKGYTNISMVYRSPLEEKDRMCGAWDRETIEVVAQTPQGGFERIRCIIYQEYQPFRRTETPTPTAVTYADYAAALAQHGRYDTPEFLQKIAEKKRKMAKCDEQRRKAQAWVNAHRPNCPKCGKSMRRCSGEKVNFWGCRTFPQCKGKIWMSAKYKYADFAGAR